MKDYIAIPYWLQVDYLSKLSENIAEFILCVNAKAIDDKIDLNYLREYYSINRVNAIDLVDELYIRGFTFVTSKKTSILPEGSVFENKEIIVVNKSGKNFEKIKFDYIGLAGFIKRFSIIDDLYFDKISLCSFKYFNNSINKNELFHEFKKNGFSIVETLEDINNDIIEGADLMDCNNNDEGKSDIDKLFYKNEFKYFRVYCRVNQIKEITDLKETNFEDVSNFDGICNGKIKETIFKYREILRDIKNIRVSSVETTIKNIIHDDYKNVTIDYVFKDNILSFFYENEVKTIEQLQFFDNNKISGIEGIGIKREEQLIGTVRKFSLPLSLYLYNAFEEGKSTKGYEEYREVVFNKKTLEQVGKEKIPEVTRERIRQKKVKYEESVLSVLLLCEEILYLKGQLEKSFDFEVLSDLLGSYDNAIIARQIINDYSLKHIIYLKEFDLFLIDVDLEYIYDSLEEIVERLGDIFNFYDEMIGIEEMLVEKEMGYIDVFTFPDYLLSIGYKKMNNFYAKGRVSRELLLGMAVKQYFPDGIENNADDISKVQGVLLSDFGEEPVPNDKLRNVWTKIERNDKIILWGKSRRNHIDNVKISEAILLKINEIITDALSSASSISADYLYQQLQVLLEKAETNIKSKEALYGVVQYYFKDAFAFKKLVIKTLETGQYNSQMVLEKYVLNNEGYVTVKDVRNNFKWTDAMYSAAVNFNKNLLLWNDYKEIIHLSLLNISTEFIEQFYAKIIECCFIEGYTNGYMIAKRTQVLLLKNGIKPNGASAYSLVKSLYDDKFFISRRPHILKENQESQFTVSKLILSMFEKKTIVTYGEMKDHMLNDYCFNEIMAGNHIAKVLIELFQVDIDQYCIRSLVQYTGDDINAVSEQCERLLDSRGYSVLAEFDRTDLLKRKVKVGEKMIEFNQYVAKSIINLDLANKYRIIVRKGFDWRFDSIILVSNESIINNFADALIYILENEFKDKENCIVDKIEEFLIERKIIYKKIPEEFFMSSKVALDEFGRVTINT